MHRTAAIFVVGALAALTALSLSSKHGSERREARPARAGSLSLAAQPSSSHLNYGGDGELYLDIAIDAQQTVPWRRLPLNLALVLDRSGSMGGEKLEHARAAARSLIERLHDGDWLAVVTYGSDVSVLVPASRISPSTRPAILAAVSGIVDRGGTFLAGGIESGRDEVLKHRDEKSVNRVILISDGQANEGPSSAMELTALARETLAQGIHLTSMGVGLDYDEEILTAIAEHGGGHYYFIQESQALERFFREELETMTHVVAQRVVLQMDLDPGVELLQLYGYPYEQRAQQLTTRLPDLHGGQQRRVICQLKVPVSRESHLHVGRVELRYVDAFDAQERRLARDATVTVTRDRLRVAQGQQQKALARVQQVQAAATMLEAMQAYSRGDVSRSAALLQAQSERTRRANQRLKDKALDQVLADIESQLRGTAAPPASPAGQALIKAGKYRSYQLRK